MGDLAEADTDRDLRLVREYMDRARSVLEEEAARLRAQPSGRSADPDTSR